ncbi:MAG: AraC family transcriptional regulator [Acidobacteria bacterium]|nr:AraC family transcriptional regulator [Acidobacteriota bacterium]
MTAILYRPQPPLSQFVETIWMFEGHVPQHRRERILPTGVMQMVINLHEEDLRIYDRQHPDRYQSFGGGLLSGTHSEYIVVDTSQQGSVIGVHFKPGGAFPLFRMPADELKDTAVSLETLWKIHATVLHEQLLAAATPLLKVRLLEQFLLAQAARPWERHPAVAFALNEFTRGPLTRPISEITDQIGLSSRRFIQVFKQETGLTPKVFCRIQRFQKVLATIGMNQDIDWVDLALECGYFDQAHFIHDFRSFAGLSPSTYLAHRTNHINHVPLVE